MKEQIQPKPAQWVFKAKYFGDSLDSTPGSTTLSNSALASVSPSLKWG